jgi:hypothetical protein
MHAGRARSNFHALRSYLETRRLLVAQLGGSEMSAMRASIMGRADDALATFEALVLHGEIAKAQSKTC